MSALAQYHNAARFVAGTDLHTTNGLATLWDGIRQLDMASLAPRDAFCGHADHRHEFVGQNPLRFWRGGYRYRVGYTTLAVYIHTTSLGTDVTPRLRVTVNGVVRIDATIATGTQLYSATGMASWGLSDGQVAEVAMEIYDGGAPSPSFDESSSRWGTYYLVDAFVGPVSGVDIGEWPGVPEFTTGPDPAKAQQLANAANWLANRLALVPQPLFQRVVSSAELPYWSVDPGDPHMWSGGGVRGPFDRLVAKVVWLAGSAVSQRIRLLVNGSEVDTTATFGAGSWGQDVLVADLSDHSATAVLRAELQLVIITGADAGPGRPTRVSTEYVELQRSSPPFQTITNRPEPDALTTWATRKGHLNAMSSWLQVIKNRIDNDVDRWDRVRLFRSSYAYDLGEADYLKGRYHAVRRARTGRRLIVRGAGGVILGWGAWSARLTEKDDPNSEYEWSWAGQETLISGDQVETKEIWLDTLPGLEYGMQYTVYGGDVRYAGEEPR